MTGPKSATTRGEGHGSLPQSGWADSNRRPLDPQSSALTKLRYTPPVEERSLGVPSDRGAA